MRKNNIQRVLIYCPSGDARRYVKKYLEEGYITKIATDINQAIHNLISRPFNFLVLIGDISIEETLRLKKATKHPKLQIKLYRFSTNLSKGNVSLTSDRKEQLIASRQ